MRKTSRGSRASRPLAQYNGCGPTTQTSRVLTPLVGQLLPLDSCWLSGGLILSMYGPTSGDSRPISRKAAAHTSRWGPRRPTEDGEGEWKRSWEWCGGDGQRRMSATNGWCAAARDGLEAVADGVLPILSVRLFVSPS